MCAGILYFLPCELWCRCWGCTEDVVLVFVVEVVDHLLHIAYIAIVDRAPCLPDNVIDLFRVSGVWSFVLPLWAGSLYSLEGSARLLLDRFVDVGLCFLSPKSLVGFVSVCFVYLCCQHLHSLLVLLL